MHLKKILKKKIYNLSSSSLNVGQIEPHPKEVFFHYCTFFIYFIYIILVKPNSSFKYCSLI